MIISVFDKIQNIVGNGENAGYQHFLLFPQCFQKASIPNRSKGVIVWEWVKTIMRALSKNSKVVNESNCAFADSINGDRTARSGSVLTNHSQEHSLSFFSAILKI